MKRIRYAVIGSGWRSLFYIRIAKALPERFELCMLLCRTEEKADMLRRAYGIPVTCSQEDVFAANPDFIVSAVSRESMCETALRWMEFGWPVLSETPPADTHEELCRIWELCRSGCRPVSPVTGRPADYRLQVAEQYFAYPQHEARTKIIASGLIGDPVSVTISYMHDYHAVSLIRRLLQVGFEDVAVVGKKFSFPVTDTRTRTQVLTEGTVVPKEQAHLILEYESGRTAFYDFCSDQYRSPIRNRFLNVRGTRGEIINDTVHYLNRSNLPETAAIATERDPATGEVLSISFRGETLYTPPFGPCGLPEDETAIARLLAGMDEFLTAGNECYPLAEALEDAEVGRRMREAADHPWQMQSPVSRPWK